MLVSTSDPIVGYIHTGRFTSFPQVGLQGCNDRKQADLITAVAIQRLQEQRHVAIMGGRQGEHPLLEIIAMIARVAIDDGDDRCIFSRLHPVVLATDRK